MMLLLILSLILFQSFAHAYYYPPPLYGQTSIYIDSKIYFFGGTVKNINESVTFHDKIIYLDLSKSFNTYGIIPWFETSISSNFSNHILASACIGGLLNERIFIFGGYTLNDITFPLIYIFDSPHKDTYVPSILNPIIPPRRINVQAICDKAGLMYIFGGKGYVNDITTEETIYNRFDIFNTTELGYGWLVGNVEGSGGARHGYSAVLVDNVIHYIGGMMYDGIESTDAKMNEIYFYDTVNQVWAWTKAVGDVPGGRQGHSAILTTYGVIIIYGGVRNNFQEAATPQFAVLDITTSTYSWSQPILDSAPSIYSHSANLIDDKYMIMTFGFIPEADRRNEDIFILDISNPEEYKWTAIYETDKDKEIVKQPFSIQDKSTIITPSLISDLYFKSDDSKGIVLLGSVIGSILSFLIAAATTFFTYRRN